MPLGGGSQILIPLNLRKLLMYLFIWNLLMELYNVLAASPKNRE